MKRYAVLVGMILAGLEGIAPLAVAQEVYTTKPTFCETGYQLVEETAYKEVEHTVCKVVPNQKTKWVYSSRPDYYCLPGCPFHGQHCEDGSANCESCKGPYCRQQLLKKKVEWTSGTKCVTEVVKDMVPCTVWRKVPCGPVSVGPPHPNAAPAPSFPAQVLGRSEGK